MEETFNVGNPTRENIDYAFKNLIYYVTASTQLDIYKEQKENFEKDFQTGSSCLHDRGACSRFVRKGKRTQQGTGNSAGAGKAKAGACEC